jgi:hypothetical protein
MYRIDNVFASVDSEGNYIATYPNKESAIAESPVKKVIEGFVIIGDTAEDDLKAVENSRSFYYTKKEAQSDLKVLIAKD